MADNSKDSKPIYEKPGRLSPDRAVPNVKDPDNDIVSINVHYDDAEEITAGKDLSDSSVRFAGESARVIKPIEDEDLIFGQKKIRSRGKNAGVSPVQSKIYVPETDKVAKDVTDDVTEEERTISEQVPQPLFFKDISSVTRAVIIMGAVIIIEITGLVLLMIL